MKPLVSIIVPAYNLEEYIGRCLDSLINQSYDNLQIIVINDGSSDNTGKIINKYCNIDNRITAIHKKNEGVSEARNVGIEQARGEYIGFVDGDDTVEKNMFETLIKNAIQYKADISHCGYKMIFPSRIDYYYNTEKIIIQDNIKGISDLLKADIIEPALCNKIYKSSLFSDVKLNEDIKYNEDLLMNYYLFKKSRKSIFYDKPMYNYIIRNGSASTGKVNIKKIEDPLKVIEEIINDIDYNEEIYNIAYNRYIYRLINMCKYKNVKSSNEMKLIYKKYKKYARKKLKENYKGIVNNGNVNKKIKVMTNCIVFIPSVFNFIYYIYSYISKNEDKYKVE